MNNKVAITGATGYIGRRLSLFLSEQGYAVHRILRPRPGMTSVQTPATDHFCSLSDPAALSTLFANIRPRIILHLASYAVPNRSLSDFGLQNDNTVMPTVNIALSAPVDTELVAFFGSCEEYGSGPVPFLEDQTPVCVSPYGWGKISAHMGASYVATQRGLRWTWLRPFLTYGPEQSGQNFVPWVLHNCLEKRASALTPGEQTRDFIYIEDLQHMILRVLQNPEPALGQSLNLCTGIPHSVRSMAESIRDAVGAGELQFGAIPYRDHEVMSFFGSTAKYRKLYGDFQHTPLKTALAQTVAFETARIFSAGKKTA